MVRVKVCGITLLEDALFAARMGADMLGFILAPSPRRVAVDTARTIIRGLPPEVMTVGVFVNAPLDEMLDLKRFCGLGMLQLHGNESEEVVQSVGLPVIKAFRVADAALDCEDAFPGATLPAWTRTTPVPSAEPGRPLIGDWPSVRHAKDRSSLPEA